VEGALSTVVWFPQAAKVQIMDEASNSAKGFLNISFLLISYIVFC